MTLEEHVTCTYTYMHMQCSILHKVPLCVVWRVDACVGWVWGWVGGGGGGWRGGCDNRLLLSSVFEIKTGKYAKLTT